MSGKSESHVATMVRVANFVIRMMIHGWRPRWLNPPSLKSQRNHRIPGVNQQLRGKLSLEERVGDESVLMSASVSLLLMTLFVSIFSLFLLIVLIATHYMAELTLSETVQQFLLDFTMRD